MDALCRLSETDCYQAMDEMVRVVDKENGKIIQITEEPPEVRQEKWFKWSKSSPYTLTVKQKKFMEKYIYEITFNAGITKTV
jgi:hypothetical protein